MSVTPFELYLKMLFEYFGYQFDQECTFRFMKSFVQQAML